MQRYVAYLRVNSQDEGRSALGLTAQARDIELFLETHAPTPYEVIATFREVQTGPDHNRPQLEAALALVGRTSGCELLVAKLDRLSQHASVISAFMEDQQVRFRVASMPQADNAQLYVYAVLAEQERAFISMRTKAALAVAKARGVKLGGLKDKTGRRNAAVQDQARLRASEVGPMIRAMHKDGKPLQAIADQLNSAGVPTARGGLWHASQVRRVLARLREVGLFA
ncbi:DNA invertase [Rubellimicrobium roseum]|uniref:DNA invertase n=1 Tax=Rubellimicrobium roseum TaxID=687525 RepID=A0A5C4N8L3_9RHOB|nr:DNA invertase [Rubellimicrobium roseum]